MIPSSTDRLEGTTEPTIGQLVAAIKDDITGLVRGEVDLAKAELRDQAKAAGAATGMIVAAIVLAVFGLVMLSMALAYGIHALGLGLGWSFLIVAGLYLVIAATLVLIAKGGFSKMEGPKRTQRTTRQVTTALKRSTDQ